MHITEARPRASTATTPRRSMTFWANRSKLLRARSGSGRRPSAAKSVGRIVSSDERLAASNASRPMLPAAWSGRRHPAAASLGVSELGKSSMAIAPRAQIGRNVMHTTEARPRASARHGGAPRWRKGQNRERPPAEGSAAGKSSAAAAKTRSPRRGSPAGRSRVRSVRRREGQMSKYSMNSYGCGRMRTGSTSRFRLYSIQVSMASCVKTSPFSMNS